MSNTGIQRPDQGNGITLTNETTAKNITNYINFKINEYTKRNFKDKSLWESYQEDFNNFKVQTFKDAHRSAIKELKQLLRRNGVWVFNKKSKSVPQVLYNVAHKDDPTEQSDKEIKLFINNEGPFNSYIINRRLESRPSTPLMSSATPASAASNNLTTAEPPSPTNASNTQPTEAKATTNYGRDLATLAKMYTEESKYSKEDDNFNRKLTIFNDLYNRVNIPQEAKIKGFPTMLHGITLNFYYRNKATYVTFDGICNAIRNHFEGPEYKRRVLTKWNAITLKTVMIKSEGKSTEDCLQLLLNNLRHLQHGLDANLRNDDFLHNKLIVACQDVAACQAAYSNPPATLTGLMNSLRSSIITYEKIKGIGQPANVFLQPTEQSANVFFTDRRYHRSTSRPNSSNNRYGNNARTCFVCKKGDYQSTRHTKEERDEAREGFKRRVHQYLADNNIDDNFNKDITAIAFNTSTPTTVLTTTSGNFFYNNYGVEHFITSNRPIPIKTAKNIVTSINNNAFIHGLTGSTEPSGTEPSNTESGTARCGDKVNTKNLTLNIDFLNCHFNDNGQDSALQPIFSYGL